MHAVQATLRSHPGRPSHPDVIGQCIEACFNCAGTCTACADACLSERNIDELLVCIRHNLDCAAICIATGSVVARAKSGASRQVLESQLNVCIAVCRACGDECSRHAKSHAHCKACADACEASATVCTEMLAALRTVT